MDSYKKHQSYISDFHDTPVAGHKGAKATYNALRKHYRWKGMKEQVQQYVKYCQQCQKSKVRNKPPTGTLLPLPTPEGPWQDISVDFTELPPSLGYNNLMVVIDHFLKEVVFVPCTKEETSKSTAELFRDHIWCQHGLPKTVVSDRGLVFASQFTEQLHKLLGIKRKMSTTFHPQTDGQTEQLNHEVAQCLRTYVNDCQKEWANWIKLAQFVWNNTISSVTTDSPFGITQSYEPHMGVEPVETKAPAVKDFAQIFKRVVEASEKAKKAVKLQADKHRSPAPNYEKGQQVWLSTDNLRMLNCPLWKLTEQWVGPYEITTVLPNAVKLMLPKSLKIHLVVNISHVKPYMGSLPGQPIYQPGLVKVSTDHEEEFEVDYLIDSHFYRRQLQYLVHWKGYENFDHMWEPAPVLTGTLEAVKDFHRQNPSAPWKLQMVQMDFDALFSCTPSPFTTPGQLFCSLESCS